MTLHKRPSGPNGRTSIGGYYGYSGSDYPGSDREYNLPDGTGSVYTARATLIISDTVS